MTPREPGFYWVRLHGEWFVAEWFIFDDDNPTPERMWWYLTSHDGEFQNSEFDDIGPKIDPPTSPEPPTSSVKAVIRIDDWVIKRV